MYVSGDLGFSSLVLVVCLVFPVIGLVIRRQWRLAVVRKEGVRKLLILASEEAARAELEASVGYGVVSVSGGYHCAVCYCPTTTRCARCKAVRYCSGKCQIIHWRQGHKDECHPPSTTFWTNDEGSDSGKKVAEQDPHKIYGDRFETEDRWLAEPVEASRGESVLSDSSSSPEVPYGNIDDVKLVFRADRKERILLLNVQGTHFLDSLLPLLVVNHLMMFLSVRASVQTGLRDQTNLCLLILLETCWRLLLLLMTGLQLSHYPINLLVWLSP